MKTRVSCSLVNQSAHRRILVFKNEFHCLLSSQAGGSSRGGGPRAAAVPGAPRGSGAGTSPLLWTTLMPGSWCGATPSPCLSQAVDLLWCLIRPSLAMAAFKALSPPCKLLPQPLPRGGKGAGNGPKPPPSPVSFRHRSGRAQTCSPKELFWGIWMGIPIAALVTALAPSGGSTVPDLLASGTSVCLVFGK